MNFYSYYPTSDDGSINRATSIENYYNKQQMITNSKKKTKKGGSGGSTTTGKHRGGGGVGVKLSTDPQSVAARERRHKISEKFKTLQSLLPGGRGSKLDTVSMLEQAIQYVKFLKDQISMHQDLMLTMNTTSSNNQHHYLDYHDAHAGIGGLILDHRPFFDEIPNPDDHDCGIISTDNSSSRQLLWSSCTPNANNVTVQDGLHRHSEVAVPLTDLVVNNESIDPACSSIVWPYQAAEPHYYDTSQWGTISWEHPQDCAWVNQGG